MKNKGRKKNGAAGKAGKGAVNADQISRIMSSGFGADDSEDDDVDLSSVDDAGEDIEFGSEGDTEDSDGENGQEPESDEEQGDEEEVEADQEANSEPEEEINSDDEEGNMKHHKKSLNKLKDTDPSFYKFLLANDKELLNFEASDSDSEVDDADKVHKPPEMLQEDSEEDSDFEKEDEYTGEQVNITNKMIDEWTDNLKSECSLEVVAEVVQAFQSAIVQLHGKDESSKTIKYHFVGAGQFNTLMQSCLSYMFSAFKKILKMPVNLSIAQPMKSKRWKKARQHIKLYLDTLIKYLGIVSSDDVQAVMLKHFHQMSLFVVCFPKLCKGALRLLVKLWSEGLSQPVRILAFLCLARFACNRQNQMLEMVLKVMYVTYVRNTRFVSPGTLANINFMRLSMVELFSVDEAASYQQAFLYIRQLAIHLRNAVRVHKKETLQTVCNWQYISSLQLWCTLLAKSMKSSPLKMLLYPVIEITLGAVQLFSSPQYYPLRFHCAKMLTFISRCSPTFVPVLPLICEVLDSYDFNKKHKHVSMKPLQFNCILRVNKHQQMENGFKDQVLEQIYSVLLEYLTSQSYSIAFPDLVVPLTSHLNKFLSTCKVAAFVKKLKSLQEKIDENNKFIEAARKAKNVNLSKESEIDAWDAFVRNKVSPLDAFYQNWRKAFEERKFIRQKQHLDESSVPKMRKHTKRDMDSDSDDGPPELFPSDDEDDSDINILKGGESDDEDIEPVVEVKKRKIVAPVVQPAKKAKPAFVAEDDVEDIIEDLDDF